VLKLEPKSEMSVKLYSNIISGATDGLVYARNGPLQQVESCLPWIILIICLSLDVLGVSYRPALVEVLDFW
jgi:hypothetical protein